MTDKIGKYEILERIARGGMGTIFKAHDPVLGRSVAVKMISTDVEVTDELRARFFREAQACARLSHPNIVTVFDMGEDNGRLFIVMELLEGQELRRLIADRASLAIEEKVSIMARVCDGLHYAHQMGVVHRDVKPGNILLLRNGQVKILDFGIARIAATEADLTRTGLIMGTLRYIAPEQVRGRADHRSDIFSVGAVFYELLSFRPPFVGEDPIEILDRLRNEDPVPLTEIDSTIPSELASIVEHAMRKDPADRFVDLEEMRLQLEEVQQRLGEEAQLIRRRLPERYARLRELQDALARYIGASSDDDPPPLADERGRLATLRALEKNLLQRIETSQAKIDRAERLASSLERGLELFRTGFFAESIAEFEAIVGEMPDHVRAREALSQARLGAENERRRLLVVRLVQEARNALDDGRYAACLEALEQVDRLPPPAALAADIGSLRETAQARLAGQRRAHDSARKADAEAAGARARALTEGAPEHARSLWDAAEIRSTEGRSALGSFAADRAIVLFGEAAALYRQAEQMSAERRQERLGAEEALERTERARHSAETVRAGDRAPEIWQKASVQVERGRGSLERHDYGIAKGEFEHALTLYHEAKLQAVEVSERERANAQHTRQVMVAQRERAVSAQAAALAPTEWASAEVSAASGEMEFSQEKYADASRIFEEGVVLFGRAEDAAVEIARKCRAAEEERDASIRARDAAAAMEAASYASELWRRGESSWRESADAMNRGEYEVATALFRDACQQYAAAAASATEAKARQVDTIVKEAQRSFNLGDMEVCLQRVEQVLALRPGDKLALRLREQALERLRATQMARQVAEGVSEQPTIRDDRTLLIASPIFESPEEPVVGPSFGATRVAVPPHAERLGAPRRDLTTSIIKKRASRGHLLGIAVGSLVAIGLGITYWPTFFSRERTESARTIVPDATEEARRRMILARDEALKEDAAGLAPTEFDAASRKSDEAEAARGRGDIAKAERYFLEAAEGFSAAKEGAERVAKQRRVEASESLADKAQRAAAAVDALRLAPELWAKADTSLREARDASKNAAFERAEALFGVAERTYREAESIANAARIKDEGNAAAKREVERAARARETAGQSSEVEQAHRRMSLARLSAEQAGAKNLAPKLFAAAQAREGEASEALKQSKYDLATRAFAAARTAYENAAREAKQEAAAELAHQEALDGRSDAVRAGAEGFAKDTFDTARKKEGEGDDLMRRENFTGAVQSYRDASKAYATARINAQENMNKSRVEADRAREDMRREKEGARPGPAEYERGLEQERKASDSYDRRDFAGATTQFKAAGDLFAKSKASQQPSSVKPLPPFGSEETAKVRGALDEFKEAIESKDLSRLQRIWPSLTGEQLGRHRDTFDSARRYALELTVQTTRIQGNEAQVRVYRKDTLYAKDGQILRNEGPATFTLKRTQERWMIDRIE